MQPEMKTVEVLAGIYLLEHLWWLHLHRTDLHQPSGLSGSGGNTDEGFLERLNQLPSVCKAK